jgi:hypothetical protein
MKIGEIFLKNIFLISNVEELRAIFISDIEVSEFPD